MTKLKIDTSKNRQIVKSTDQTFFVGHAIHRCRKVLKSNDIFFVGHAIQVPEHGRRIAAEWITRHCRF